MIRFILLILFCVACAPAAMAQVVAETPAAPADPYLVSGIPIDMPISSPQAGRDEALVAAQKAAWEKLKGQLPDASLPAVSDSQLNKLMQSFQVAGEKISAKRYIGSFTVRFRPGPVQALAGGQAPGEAATGVAAQGAASRSVTTVTYRFRSLPDWIETQRRLRSVSAVQAQEVKVIGKAYVMVDISYMGTVESLNEQLRSQNMELQQAAGSPALLLVRRDAV